MNDTAVAAILTTVLVSLLFAVLVYVWVGLALQAVFRKTGEEGWKAWVPVYNGIVLLQLGGQSGWWMLLLVVPGASIVVYVVMIVACHRINAGFGYGGGMTVLAALLFPVWASVVGWSSNRWVGVARGHGPVRTGVPVGSADAAPGPGSLSDLFGGPDPFAPAPAVRAMPDAAAAPDAVVSSVPGAAPSRPAAGSGAAAPAGSAPAASAPRPPVEISPSGSEHLDPGDLDDLSEDVRRAAAPAAAAAFAPPRSASSEVGSPAPAVGEDAALGRRRGSFASLITPAPAPPVPPAPAVPAAPAPAVEPVAPPAPVPAPAVESVVPPALAPAVSPAPAPAAEPGAPAASAIEPVAPAAPAVESVAPAAPAVESVAPAAPAPATPAPATPAPATPAPATPATGSGAPDAPITAAPISAVGAVRSAPAAATDDSPWAPPTTTRAPLRPSDPADFSDTSGEVSAIAGAPVAGGPMSARSSVSAQRRAPEVPDAADAFDETIIAARKRTPWMLVPPLGAPIPVTADTLILGRRPSLDPTFPGAQLVSVNDETRTISKTHARLEERDGTWVITDLDSTNGVVLIDADGSEIEVDPGRPMPVVDRFLLGDAELRLTRDTV